ncbi:hypothetical protein B296_00003733 [Ensete ventricosum]|uniref:AAA+ ATPase domain-containing protein n=1 Tax=Ensete ventricosum TaxID=4639 RepID=A0A427B7B9_ENSVE|nr:hypothetical protein B296_00003733 [Ensete ventricosum]
MADAGCSQVLHSISKNSPIVLYIRDVDSLLFISKRMYSLFEKLLKRISGPVLILGSRKVESGSDFREVDEKLTLLFPYNIEIKPPEDETHLEVAPDNEFEKRIRPEVIPASEIGVTFDDIGALDDIKESLQELVMLPLRRPDLFKGGLLKPCRGILLFGPPGTGKTLLAKAIANEAGASFINVSMSTITSKWFGEDEKNVRALFTLAAKVSPTIVFVDEVDSMLGQRSRVGEHEAMRKIKNEFMTHWDGLLTKPEERILVLAATNRPFDLDEAIIRRFERRIMVGLPSQESRELILRTLLSKEKVEEKLEFKELATMTEGYNYIIQVASSFAAEGSIMSELKQWNELYGDGGSRKKQQLTYFL